MTRGLILLAACLVILAGCGGDKAGSAGGAHGEYQDREAKAKQLAAQKGEVVETPTDQNN